MRVSGGASIREDHRPPAPCLAARVDGAWFPLLGSAHSRGTRRPRPAPGRWTSDVVRKGGLAHMLPAPGFHHLHLNSVDPHAAIDFYTRRFSTTSKTRWGDFPALATPNDVLILFTKVATPPATSPQTAIWHFGWHVPDTRATLEAFTAQPDVTLLPLYTTEEGGSVFVSSDTWPGTGRTPGLTKTQI